MNAVESRVDAVKVYHRGATVTRTLTVEAGEAGMPARIEIPGLPLSLDDHSVRLSVRGVEGSGEVIAAELRVGLHARPESELPREPDRDALKLAERALATQRDLLSQIEQEIGLLASIPVPPRPQGRKNEPPPPSPLAARVAMEQFTDGAVRVRQDEARALREAIRKTEEQVDDLRAQLRRYSSAGTASAERVTKTVVATLRGAGAVVRAELALEYFVPGCRWAPRYQCRVSPDGASATLATRAVVAQDTGEDWRGVKLLLSTADPLRWTELPTLKSVRIGKAQPAPGQRGFRPPPQGAGALFEDWVRDSGKLSAPRVLPAEPQVRGAVRPPSLPQLGVVSLFAAEEEALEMMEEPEPMMAASVAPPAPGRSAPRKRRKGGRQDTLRAESVVMARRASVGGPPPAEASMDDESDDYGEGFGGGGAPAGPPRFALLRLDGPQERGRLRPVDPRESYRALLSRSGLRIGFDPVSLVEQASARAAAVERLPLPPGAADVRAAAANFDYAYPTAARVDVPSDGAFHSVPVDTREAGCVLRYVVVPREDTNVFRVAAIENPSAAPLLPGAVEVYVGGEYVVTAALPAVAPRARFRLGLGVEQAIKCARNTRFRESRSGAAVVATAELWHDLEITLVNGLSRAIRCEVRERIPQPEKNAEVVVEEGAVTPPWTPYDQEERRRVLAGGRRWEVEIAAGAEQKLQATYVVKIYANNEVVGGNRRES